MYNQKIFQIFIDDKPYKIKKFILNEKLSNIRKVLNINEKYVIVNENWIEIDINDEENFTLDNLIEDKKKEEFILNYKKTVNKIIVLINDKEVTQIECLLKDNLTIIRKKRKKLKKTWILYIMKSFLLKNQKNQNI